MSQSVLTKEYLTRLLTDAGHAINANNGQCALIEDVLCRVTTVCVQSLDHLAVVAELLDVLASCKVALQWESVARALGHDDRDTIYRRVCAAIARAKGES